MNREIRSSQYLLFKFDRASDELLDGSKISLTPAFDQHYGTLTDLIILYKVTF